jgi:hypothetical protein
MSAFLALQRVFAAHGIAGYPVNENKVPIIRNPQCLGIRGSTVLAEKFPHAHTLGFAAGKRNRITVVDIDSGDEAVACEARRVFGDTPFEVLTPSGGRHLYYRHNGEARRIRPVPEIDLLGSGAVIGGGLARG